MLFRSAGIVDEVVDALLPTISTASLAASLIDCTSFTSKRRTCKCLPANVAMSFSTLTSDVLREATSTIALLDWRSCLVISRPIPRLVLR